MLKAAIISPDAHLRDELEKKLTRSGRVTCLRTFEHYPDAPEVTRFVRARAPEVVFLSMETRSLALAIVRRLEHDLPGVQVVAIDRECNQQALVETIRAGVKDCLFLPFDASEVNEVLDRLSANVAKSPVAFEWTGRFIRFSLEARRRHVDRGAESSMALTKVMEERVLLADFDLSSGMLRFMLKLTQANSLREAAEWALEIDESVWPRLVTTLGKLDVLHAGPWDVPFSWQPRRCGTWPISGALCTARCAWIFREILSSTRSR